MVPAPHTFRECVPRMTSKMLFCCSSLMIMWLGFSTPANGTCIARKLYAVCVS